MGKCIDDGKIVRLIQAIRVEWHSDVSVFIGKRLLWPLCPRIGNLTIDAKPW
jgi:hypothetical protein